MIERWAEEIEEEEENEIDKEKKDYFLGGLSWLSTSQQLLCNVLFL